MRGRIFEVHEIDEWNFAWAEKWWNPDSHEP